MIFFRKYNQLSVLLAAIMLLVSSGLFIHVHACDMDGSKSISIYKYNTQSSCSSCCNKNIDEITIKENCCKETIISTYFKANASNFTCFFSFKNYEKIAINAVLQLENRFHFFNYKKYRFQYSSFHFFPFLKCRLSIFCKLNI